MATTIKKFGTVSMNEQGGIVLTDFETDDEGSTGNERDLQRALLTAIAVRLMQEIR